MHYRETKENHICRRNPFGDASHTGYAHSRDFDGLLMPKLVDHSTGDDACSISFQLVFTYSSDFARFKKFGLGQLAPYLSGVVERILGFSAVYEYRPGVVATSGVYSVLGSFNSLTTIMAEFQESAQTALNRGAMFSWRCGVLLLKILGEFDAIVGLLLELALAICNR